jgi:hypothetical protein
VDLERWRHLPTRTETSATSLDVERWLHAIGARTDDDTAAGLDVRLGERWDEVADVALRSGGLSTDWVTPTTLVACAPGSVPDRTFLAEATREAGARGARYPAPIYPADDPADGARSARWTAYRTWFPRADALDAGDLRAAAVCDPDGALDAATALIPSDVSAHRDDDGLSLAVGAFATTIDAVADAFVGLMRGFTPEQTLTAAVAQASERLRRSDALLARLSSAIGVRELRYTDGVPAYRIGDVVVVDPVAGRFLDGRALGDDWPDRLASALSPGASPRCTCEQPRVLRATLSDAPADDSLTLAVDEDRALRFLVACPHDVRAPTVAEWTEAGIDARDAVERWRAAAARTDWRVADTDDRTAVLFYGPDAAALTADGILGPAVAAACGRGDGEEATTVALAANVVLVTGPDEDPPRVQLASFDDAGFEPGAPIRFVRRVRSAGSSEPRLRTVPLGLRR